MIIGPRWRILWYVRVYQNRDETGVFDKTRSIFSNNRCIIPYINGSESSSLYTCNTSWCSVHYIILNKPLVRLTTVHYQSAVSMISFAQVLTAQWSDTIPCRNVQFQVGITSHDILFQHLSEYCMGKQCVKGGHHQGQNWSVGLGKVRTGRDQVFHWQCSNGGRTEDKRVFSNEQKTKDIKNLCAVVKLLYVQTGMSSRV